MWRVDNVFPGLQLYVQEKGPEFFGIPVVYVRNQKIVTRQVNCCKPGVFSPLQNTLLCAAIQSRLYIRGPGAIISSISELCSFTVKDTVIEMRSASSFTLKLSQHIPFPSDIR